VGEKPALAGPIAALRASTRRAARPFVRDRVREAPTNRGQPTGGEVVKRRLLIVMVTGTMLSGQER